MLGCRLSQFLFLEMGRGYVLHAKEIDLLFPDGADEWETLLESVAEFPALQAILRSHGRGSFSLKARYKFYKTKPAVAVTVFFAQFVFCLSLLTVSRAARAHQAGIRHRSLWQGRAAV